jgi:hypothetical protein
MAGVVQGELALEGFFLAELKNGGGKLIPILDSSLG